MGIAFHAAVFLAKVVRRHNINGSIIQLGRQDVLFDAHTLAKVLLRAGGTPGVSMGSEGQIFLQGDVGNALRKLKQADKLVRTVGPGIEYATDTALFTALGFSDIRSLDVSDFEGADILHDMNLLGALDKFPADAQGFELVLDGGTMEHVFHVPNFLENVFHLTKVGGCVLHIPPVNNFVDHGFYQFSPTLFVDYYAANGWEILECMLWRQTSRDNNAPILSMDYQPGDFDRLPPGTLDGMPYALFFLARKTAAATHNKIPQQGYYRRHPTWQLPE